MSNLDFSKTLLQGQTRMVQSPNNTSITVEVIFGTPGKQCTGVGICKVLSIEHVRVHWKCPSARAWLNVSPNDSISLIFDRSTLSPELTERYFGAQVFQVEEPYSMPQTVLSTLNIASFIVEPGEYKVQVSECFLVVDL